jgi:hypothetical protein
MVGESPYDSEEKRGQKRGKCAGSSASDLLATGGLP